MRGRIISLFIGYEVGKRVLPAVGRGVGHMLDYHAPTLAARLGRVSPFERDIQTRLGRRDATVDALIRKLPKEQWRAALKEWAVASTAHHLTQKHFKNLSGLAPGVIEAWVLQHRMKAIGHFGRWVAQQAAVPAARHVGRRVTRSVKATLNERWPHK
jgi:hypothetical protein